MLLCSIFDNLKDYILKIFNSISFAKTKRSFCIKASILALTVGAGAPNPVGGAGGSGIVILRFPTLSYSGVTTGSPTVTTDGTDTILQYTGSGSYTT